MNLALYGIDGFHQDSTLIGEDVLREAGIIIILMMPAPGPGPPGPGRGGGMPIGLWPLGGCIDPLRKCVATHERLAPGPLRGELRPREKEQPDSANTVDVAVDGRV